MEEFGIGRPSTYAYILQILQDRGYVHKEKRAFFPSHKGVLVALFLKKFFEKYVEQGFTASLEERLDDVSSGKIAWEKVLKDFWDPFYETIQGSEKLKITEVLESVEKDMLLFLFPDQKGADIDCGVCGGDGNFHKEGEVSSEQESVEEKSEGQSVEEAQEKGQMRLRLGRYGPFLSCSRYPQCRNIRNLDEEGSLDAPKPSGSEVFGVDPQTQESIKIKKGPFGYYLEWENTTQRVSVPKTISPEDLTLEDVLLLKQIPLKMGEHPQGGEITLGAGRFGPYVKYGGQFFSIKGKDRFWTLSIEEALSLIGSKSKKLQKTSGGKKVAPKEKSTEKTKTQAKGKTSSGKTSPRKTSPRKGATDKKNTDSTQKVKKESQGAKKKSEKKSTNPKKQDSGKALEKAQKVTKKPTGE